MSNPAPVSAPTAAEPSSSTSSPAPWSLIALIIAATAVGFAIFQHGGEYTPWAMGLITVALVATIAAVVATPWRGAAVGSAPRTVFRDAFRLPPWERGRPGRIPLANAGETPALPENLVRSADPTTGAAPDPAQLLDYAARPSAAANANTCRWVKYTIAVALTLQFFALFTLWPVGEDHKGRYLELPNHILYLVLIAMSGGLALAGFTDLPSVRKGWFPALLLAHSLLGFWTVRSSPVPHIDVWYFQEEGPSALLHGRNPYDADQVQFPDIYQSTLPGHQRVYGDGLVQDGVLKFGFPYPPVSLYCSTIGCILGNDTRFAQAIALTLAGLFLGYCRPGLSPKLAAALLMFTPQVWFILGRAWTEPFVVMFLAATIFCACRKVRWALPVAFGLFLASKQYLVFAVPLSFLLIDDFGLRRTPDSLAASLAGRVQRRYLAEIWRRWGWLLVGSALVALLATLPMVLWNPRAFWFSTVTVQKIAPFRWDALSYMVWAGFNLDSKYTTWTWLAFAAVAPALLLAICKARRSPAGFAMALALVYLVFIAFNKQAFCNYYFFVIGCLCCAIGATKADDISEF